MTTKNEKSDKSEKSAANKLTEKVGLVFNVHTVKASMQQYFKSQGLEAPKFSGAQVALTACMQELCKIMMKACLQHTNKDKTDIKNLNRSVFKFSILLNDGLNEYYNMKMKSFDKNQMYESQFPVSMKEVKKVISSVDKDLYLTPKAYNFLNFLLMKAYLDVISTAYQFLEFADRKTFNAKAIAYALKLRFSDSITFDLCAEMNRAMTALGEEGANMNNDEDKEEKPAMETQADSGDEADDGSTKVEEAKKEEPKKEDTKKSEPKKEDKKKEEAKKEEPKKEDPKKKPTSTSSTKKK